MADQGFGGYPFDLNELNTIDDLYIDPETDEVHVIDRSEMYRNLSAELISFGTNNEMIEQRNDSVIDPEMTTVDASMMDPETANLQVMIGLPLMDAETADLHAMARQSRRRFQNFMADEINDIDSLMGSTGYGEYQIGLDTLGAGDTSIDYNIDENATHDNNDDSMSSDSEENDYNVIQIEDADCFQRLKEMFGRLLCLIESTIQKVNPNIKASHVRYETMSVCCSLFLPPVKEVLITVSVKLMLSTVASIPGFDYRELSTNDRAQVIFAFVILLLICLVILFLLIQKHPLSQQLAPSDNHPNQPSTSRG